MRQQGQLISMAGSGMPEWVCPLHDDVKIVPAGISKRTGKAYTAFYACPVGGCDENGTLHQGLDWPLRMGGCGLFPPVADSHLAR